MTIIVLTEKLVICWHGQSRSFDEIGFVLEQHVDISVLASIMYDVSLLPMIHCRDIYDRRLYRQVAG